MHSGIHILKCYSLRNEVKVLFDSCFLSQLSLITFLRDVGLIPPQGHMLINGKLI